MKTRNQLKKKRVKLRFGSDKVFKSIQCVTFPTFIANKNILLTTEVIENDTRFLLGKGVMKKAKTYIGISEEKIKVLMKKYL